MELWYIVQNNAHNQKEITTKDDLESLGYVLVYCLKGKLPWDISFLKDIKDSEGESLMYKIKNQKEYVRNYKENISIQDLCEDLPEQFEQYFAYIDTLEDNEIIDFVFLRSLFKQILLENRFSLEIEVWFQKFQKDVIFTISSKKEKYDRLSNGT